VRLKEENPQPTAPWRQDLLWREGSKIEGEVGQGKDASWCGDVVFERSIEEPLVL
jgi:hypothetical protein